MAGRKNLSTILEATMPTTPLCQDGSARTMVFLSGLSRPSLGDELAGVVEDFSFESLALGVLAFEVVGDLGGVGWECGGEQLDGEAGVADSAGGVEHRGETKADVVAVEAFAGKLGGFDEGAEAGQFGVGEQDSGRSWRASCFRREAP